MATGANEHPCAVAPLGYVLVPELPQYLQVLSISNSFCIHICQRRTSSKTVVELCKNIFNPQKKNFTKRDSLFCDSFFLCILHAARTTALPFPCAKGDAPCGKRNVPKRKNPAGANAPTGFIRSASAPLYFSCKDQLTSVSDRNVP